VVTEVQWINQWGRCDGPHAEINNGKRRYPLGRTAIRKFMDGYQWRRPAE
jgi:hypothetical protein